MAEDIVGRVVGLWRDGQRAAAERLLLDALERHPGVAEFHVVHGLLLQETGRTDAAVAAFRRAIDLQPTEARTYDQLGVALQGVGELGEALSCYRQALAIDPGLVEARYNLGVALQARGDLAGACACYEHVAGARPDLLAAWVNLGNALRESGRLDEAIARLEQGAAKLPDQPELLSNLGDALRARGRCAEAVTVLERALAVRPDHLAARLNLAAALHDLARFTEALAAYDAVAAAAPNAAVAHFSRAATLRALNRFDEAEAAYHRAIALDPAHAKAWTGLGNLMQTWGRAAEAVECYREALARQPDDAAAHGNLIFVLDMVAEADAAVQQGERRLWYEAHCRPADLPYTDHANRRDPERRLRVGYVSPDFREHSAAAAFGLVLRHHDRRRVEVFCYSDTAIEDARTREFRQAGHWRAIRGLSDGAVAEMVRADGIDVLVDLAAHTAGNRLHVFARRPAPVQVTAWGHANGTGLPTVDALFSDPYAIPIGQRPLYAEAVVDLPCLICFDPPAEAPPPAPRPPGPPAFGWLGRVSKLTEGTLDLWSDLLRRVPDAVLVLKDRPLDDAAMRRRITEAFAVRGVAAERLRLLGGTPRREHLAAYGGVDLVLDPAPHGGGMTTFEALWMGAPVLTIAGTTLTGRLAGSILRALGLDDLIAAGTNDFLAKAAAMVRAPRRDLRPRLADSALADPTRYVAAVEDAYRALWRRWCATGSARPPAPAPAPPAADLPSRLHGFVEAHALASEAADLEAKGRLGEAIARYRLALAIRPDHWGALVKLALAYESLGEHAMAEGLCRAAVHATPEDPVAHCALGFVLRRQGRAAEAAETYRRALAADADCAEALCNLAVVLIGRNELNDAEPLVRRAVTADPTFALGHAAQGLLLDARGDREAAIAAYRTALRHDPRLPLALNNLGAALYQAGRFDECLACYRKAVVADPANTQALLNLASALKITNQVKIAVAYARQAVATAPQSSETHAKLGEMLLADDRYGPAIAAYRQALRLAPEDPSLYSNLGAVHYVVGEYQAARRLFRRARRIAPAFQIALCNEIFTCEHDPTTTAAEQQGLRKEWYRLFGEPIARAAPPPDHTNRRDPDKRLRVGYVSADYRRHSASQAFGLVIHGHDRSQVEVVCYSSTIMQDSVTEEFKAAADVWREVRHLDDAQLADLVRADGIDILVDLTAYSGGMRLSTFVRKPAPVQITAWGHANGTGVPQIDVLFSDPVAIVAEERRHYVETIVDLPAFICCRPPQPSPDVGPPPFARHGAVTFGCFNRLSKLSPAAMAAWGRIMAAVPDSRLLLKEKGLTEPEHRDAILAKAEAAGIARERVACLGGTPQYAHLDAFNAVDLALDPFPYGGGMSTLEALWMGVPVVTLKGGTHTARLAAALNAAVGLPELIATAADQYVRLAVELARDRARLAEYRRTLRDRLVASPAANPAIYARAVEDAYRKLWRNWCATGKACP